MQTEKSTTISNEITDIDDIIPITSNSPNTTPTYFFQIDVMKSIAIFCVIAIHSMWMNSENLSLEYEYILWWFVQCVQLFVIIMGFNFTNSVLKKDIHTMKELYFIDYFKKTFLRFILFILLVNIVFYFLISPNPHAFFMDHLLILHPSSSGYAGSKFFLTFIEFTTIFILSIGLWLIEMGIKRSWRFLKEKIQERIDIKKVRISN